MSDGWFQIPYADEEPGAYSPHVEFVPVTAAYFGVFLVSDKLIGVHADSVSTLVERIATRLGWTRLPLTVLDVYDVPEAISKVYFLGTPHGVVIPVEIFQPVEQLY